MTEKRILLEGPMGRYWYLGERVWRQVKGNINAAAVPMAPPESMRHANFLQGRDLIKAIRGKDAVDFIVPDGNYESFCRRYLMPPMGRRSSTCRGKYILNPMHALQMFPS